MKKNGGLEPFFVPEAARDFLDTLDAGVLGLQHAVVYLEPYGIQYTPEIATDRIADSHHWLQSATTDPT